MGHCILELRVNKQYRSGTIEINKSRSCSWIHFSGCAHRAYGGRGHFFFHFPDLHMSSYILSLFRMDRPVRTLPKFMNVMHSHRLVCPWRPSWIFFTFLLVDFGGVLDFDIGHLKVTCQQKKRYWCLIIFRYPLILALAIHLRYIEGFRNFRGCAHGGLWGSGSFFVIFPICICLHLF